VSNELLTPTLQADGELSRGVVLRALARDAYLQVVDNLVFRILLVLVLLMVAVTFVIGFRDDHISILFGVSRVEYASVLGAMGGMFGVVGGENVGSTFVAQLQSSFATSIAGTFGALFAVVATSFFVPRMLEKGAADTLFSKPVKRGVLILSRYFGSVVFVGILASVLVFGMWLGFATASGYTDVLFLWSAPMLVYQFALLSAFSTFWGTFTRSSIATLLLTVLSWWGCAAVHLGWLGFEYMEEFESQRTELVEGSNVDVSADAKLDEDANDETSDSASAAEAEGRHPVVAFLASALTTGHLVLPKTGDSASLTELVRQSLHGETLTLLGGIDVRGQTLAVYERGAGDVVVRSVDGNEALFTDAIGKLLEMEARRPLYLRVNADRSLESWTVSAREARRLREATDEAEAPTEGDDAEPAPQEEVTLPPQAEEARVVSAEDVEFGLDNPASFYIRRFRWDQKDLAFNPWYSLGSSVAFSALLLLLATWRVRRIDF